MFTTEDDVVLVATMNEGTGKITRVDPVKVPHRLEPFGRTGWTIAEFPSLAEARAWARENRNAAMPCWKRADQWGGQPLGI